jgi:hypothetical protein
MSSVMNVDANAQERCYICGRNPYEVGSLLGVKSVEGYEFKTLYIKEGSEFLDSKGVDRKPSNHNDYERKAVSHKKIDVVICPICRTLINSMVPH